MSSPIGKMRIYGCGGAGINIASHYAAVRAEPTSAEIQASFIDTSRSNLKPNLDQNSIYIVPGLDGSGKIRSENHEAIANVVKDILVRQKPGDFNVVIFSLSGGSGSVLGPLILSELQSRNLPVVGLVVGSDESVLTANNTLKTLKTLEAIAKKNDKPVVIAYAHNERGGRRNEVDTRLQSYVGCLAYLCSRRNEELDTKDIVHWIEFNRAPTCNVPAQLALLTITDDVKVIEQDYPNPVSVASLFGSHDEPGLTVVPDYHCDGYTDLSKAGVSNLHFVIDVDAVAGLAHRINETLNAQREVAESRPSQSALVSRDDRVHDNGLVLD